MKKLPRMTTKRIIAALAFILIIAVSAAAAAIVSRHSLDIIKQPQQLREWADNDPVYSRAAYIMLTIIQVIIAFIPGEPLEILGGLAFGAVEGTLLFLCASAVGSTAVFLLTRRFGMSAATIFFSEERLRSLSFLKTSPKKNYLFFLIYALPGTPKDMLSYFAGLTDMRLSLWLVICTFGRLPSLVSSAAGGSALGSGKYLHAVTAFAAAAAVSLAGMMIYNRLRGHGK